MDKQPDIHYAQNIGHHILQNTTLSFESSKIIHKKCLTCGKEYEMRDEELQEAYLAFWGVPKEFKNICGDCIEGEIAKNGKLKK